MSIIVSILAHPERWALLNAYADDVVWEMFQSSPTPKGGRYHAGLLGLTRTKEFQSSPTPKGGRYSGMRTKASLGWSFNPRPPRKVGATGLSRPRWQRESCFNPRPPRKVGATRYLRTDLSSWLSFNPRPPRKVGATMSRVPAPRASHFVSILAHPERWALRGPLCNAVFVNCLFQSSPTPKGGRYVRVGDSAGSAIQFQSSPTPKGGRYE